MGLKEKCVVVFVLCACVYFASAQNTIGSQDDCETRDYMRAVMPNKKFEMMCNGTLRPRPPACAAAYDCCAKRKQNYHCRKVCHLKAGRLLNQDGTWNKKFILRLMLADWGMELGTEIGVETIECVEKYGNYKESKDCHGIEKVATCLQDISIKVCGTMTENYSEGLSFKTGVVKCAGKVNNVPTFLMQTAEECSQRTNSTYEFYRCYWREIGTMNDDNTCNGAQFQNWAKIVYGKVQGPIVSSFFVKALAKYDAPNLWNSANPDNWIDVLGDYMADLKEAHFQACGEPSFDLITTMP